MEKKLSQGEQADLVIRFLQQKEKLSKSTDFYKRALTWISLLVSVDGERYQALLKEVCRVFDVSEQEIFSDACGVPLGAIVNGQPTTRRTRESGLLEIVPKKSWLDAYVQYTMATESPLSYHIFSALCVLGATLARRVYVRMGFFNIYPAYAALLIGPPGRVFKTSAVEITKHILRAAEAVEFLPDKMTPEALADGLAASAHRFWLAPELSVSLGKQKYNVGLAELLLRVLDSPDEWKAQTIGRGEVVVCNLAVTFLGCSTPSLISTSTPEQISSSGFLSRVVTVHEDDSERCFPVPTRGPDHLFQYIVQTLKYLQTVEGELGWTSEARDWWDKWYRQRKKEMRELDNEVLLETNARKPTHLLRTAMLLHLAHHTTMELCVECLEVALGLLDYSYATMPAILRGIAYSAANADADRVLAMLEKMGGVADHSKLLRRTQLDSAGFKRALNTLKDQGLVKERPFGKGTLYSIARNDGTTTIQ